MSPKIIVVVGATGNQGSSVVKTFASLPNWIVRAMTRNASSEKAKTLAKLGAELVEANLEDIESLRQAFDGAHAIFLNTDFWAPYMAARSNGASSEEATPIGHATELGHVQNAATVAAELPTLERFVYSALGPMTEASHGKYPHSGHWDSKAAAVAYIQNSQKALAAKTSFIYLGSYSTNPLLLPQRDATMGTYVLMLPASIECRMPIIDVTQSTGLFVRALVEDEAAGTTLLAYDSYLTMGEALACWTEVTGKAAEYRQVSLEDMHRATGLPYEVLDGPAFVGEFGFMAGIADFIEPSQLRKRVGTPSYGEFLRLQSSEYLLQSEFPSFG